jgi:hypothetical protein
MGDRPTGDRSMSGGSIGGRIFREGLGFWRDVAPLAEGYTRGVGQLADLFGFTPAAMLRQVVAAARAELVGRTVEIDVGSATVSLVLRQIDLESSTLGPAIGQLGDLELVADDLHWNGTTIDHALARLRNVHLQPGATPVLVAAPVEFEIAIDAPEVHRIAASTAIGQRVEVFLDGDVASVRPLKRRRLGRLDVELEPSPRHIDLVVRRVHAADRWQFGRGLGVLPRLRVPLPEVLHNRVHAVDVDDGEIILRGHVAEWREPVGPAQLELLVDRLGSYDGGLLRVPREPNAPLDGPVDRARAAEEAAIVQEAETAPDA